MLRVLSSVAGLVVIAQGQNLRASAMQMQQSCPTAMCLPAPSRCPSGSHAGNINWEKKCGGEACCGSVDCGGCVDDADDTKYVEIPPCYQGFMMCQEILCMRGQESRVKTPAGAEGEKPCCPEYECVDIVDTREALVDEEVTPPAPKVGGNRDEFGCLPSAGYSWCAAKKKCHRPWEEDCPAAVPKTKPEVSCPMASCFPAPFRCPPNSKPGNINWEKKCGGEPCCGSIDCGGCVDNNDDTKYVPVGECYREPIACAMVYCGPGSDPVLKEKAGENGAAPCCDTYECSEPRVACPLSRCAPRAPGWQCPAGSHKGNINFDKICGGEPCCGTNDCGGCVDDADDTKYVDIPYCFKERFECAVRDCKPGFEAVVRRSKGANGALPCCDVYECKEAAQPLCDPNDCLEPACPAGQESVMVQPVSKEESCCPEYVCKPAGKDVTPPRFPAVFETTDQSATLVWAAPGNGWECEAGEYFILFKALGSGGGWEMRSSTKPFIELTNLQSNKFYKVKIMAGPNGPSTTTKFRTKADKNMKGPVRK